MFSSTNAMGRKSILLKSDAGLSGGCELPDHPASFNWPEHPNNRKFPNNTPAVHRSARRPRCLCPDRVVACGMRVRGAYSTAPERARRRRRGVGLAVILKTDSFSRIVSSAAQFWISAVPYGLPHETARHAHDCDDGAIAFSNSPRSRRCTHLPRAIQML